MNDIFSFSRFARLLRYDCGNCLPRHMKIMIVYSVMILFLWNFSWLISWELGNRIPLLNFLFYVAVYLAPFFVYGEINNRKKGYNYAMLPASVLEKFLSMLLMCMVIIPTVTYLTLTLTDVVLFLLSYVGVGTFTGLEIYNPFTDGILYGFFEELLGDEFNGWFENSLVFVFFVSYTMMYNALFRKLKIVKGVLLHTVLNVFLLLTALFCLILSIDVMLEFVGYLISFLWTGNVKISAMYPQLVCFLICSIVLMLVTVYRRIRNMNY